MDVLIRLGLIGLAAVVFAFGPPTFHALALIMIPVAAGSERKQVWGFVALYFSIALVPVLIGAFDYTGSISSALAMWFLPVVLNTSVIATALSLPRVYRMIALPIAVVALSVGPLAATSIANWIPIAGALFPGQGTLGILFLLAICSMLASNPKVGALLLIGLSAVSHVHAAEQPLLIAGIDTERPTGDPYDELVMAQFYRAEDWEVATNSHATVVVFPESNFGTISSEERPVLTNIGKTVLGGARLFVDENHYQNVLINALTGKIVAGQSAPIPVVVEDSIRAIKSEYGNQFKVGQWQLGAIFCIEAANPYVSYKVFSAKPQAVVWVANVGWLTQEYLERRISNQLQLWSYLYNVPIIRAVNRRG